MAKKKYKKRYKVKKKKSILKSRLFQLLLLIFVIFSLISYFLFFSSFFQIKEIKVSGNKEVSAEKLEKIIESNTKKKILFWENRSIFLVRLGKINSLIKKTFPRIEKISSKRDFPDVITSKIEERNPVADFCYQEKCFYVDSKGIAFSKTEERGDIRIKSSEFKENISLGKSAIEKKHLESIILIEQELKRIELDPEEYIIEDKKLTVKLGSWEAYFTLEESTENQLFNLKLVLQEKIAIENRKNLDYIDLRFGNRVFVSPPLVDIVDEN